MHFWNEGFWCRVWAFKVCDLFEGLLLGFAHLTGQHGEPSIH